jgi:hypothetical protein
VEATSVVSDAVSPVGLVESIARLIAELAEVRVISDRRADRLVSLAETIGRQAAELDALRAQNAALLASTAAQPQNPITGPSATSGAPGAAVAPAPWWHSLARWWPAALAVLLVLVGAGALLVVR